MLNRSKALSVALAAIFALGADAAFAQDGMNMPMKMMKPAAKAADYRFELAGPAKSVGGGKSIVAVKLSHDGKPVTGAVIIQVRVDMGPMGMASMTAPVKTLGEKPPGTYSFEITHGPVWNKPDDWALSFASKVQGMTDTVTGKVTVKLTP
jgi:hypothetical protein